MKTFYCDLEITLKRLIPSISQKMLVQSLRELESGHLIIRKMYNQVPPKVEYSISEMGMSLKPTLRALCDWGQNYAEKTMSKDEYRRLNVE